MPFKPFYGSCPLCPDGKTVLVIVKSGLCKFHNEEKKNRGKKPKPAKPRTFKPRKPQKIKGPRFGQCEKCEPNTPKLLATKHLCRQHNEEKKREARSKRIVKLVDKVEKKKSIPYLIKKLDDIFSLFIRLRDSDKEGFGNCVTCTTVKHYTRMDCGHFITRGEKSIRWHEWNCAMQCKPCNGFGGGEQVRFREAINKRWGPNTADNLEIKRHFTQKLERFELEFLIQEYTEKVNRLMAEKSKTL